MAERVLENIVEYQVSGVSIRVWCARQRQGPSPEAHHNVLVRCVGIHGGIPSQIDEPMRVCEALTFLLESNGVHVNAIEVRFGEIGSLIYPEWP